MKKIISLFLVLVFVFSISACSNDAKNTTLEKYKKSFLDLFDTSSTLIAYDESQEKFDESYEKFYNKLKEYNNLFDIYNHYDSITNLYDVNKNAGISPVSVSQEIIDILKLGKEAYEISNGKTNICLGSVLILWHNERELAKSNPDAAKLPDSNELEKASKHTDINDLVIDEENMTVYFKDPLLQLDVGAIAKGYAVQKITEFAQENLWDNAAISIGGNVSTYGYKKDNENILWNIALENPDTTQNEYFLNLKITDKSIVTSGNYQRYYTVNGKKYCHIIDPDILMPSENMASVTVICNDSALGDALSTTLFNMSIDDGKKLVENMDDVEAVWVDLSFNKTFSSGFEKYIDN